MESITKSRLKDMDYPFIGNHFQQGRCAIFHEDLSKQRRHILLTLQTFMDVMFSPFVVDLMDLMAYLKTIKLKNKLYNFVPIPIGLF